LITAVGCSVGKPEAPAPANPVTASATPLGPAEPGLKVGEAAPKFTLKDQAGQDRSLDDLLKKGKVALVFLRSVRSFPHDRQNLVDLKDGRQQIEQAGVQVVVISSDPVGDLKDFAGKQAIPYPLFSDGGAETIKAYGVSDPKDPSVALPGTFLIDRSGVVRGKAFFALPQLRQTVGELVEAARKSG
jgi:peroxiredoxin